MTTRINFKGISILINGSFKLINNILNLNEILFFINYFQINYVSVLIINKNNVLIKKVKLFKSVIYLELFLL